MMGTYGDGTDPLEQALRARVAQGARQPPGMYVPQVSTYNLVDTVRVPQDPVSEAMYGTQTRHVAATDFDHAAALHAANQQAAYMTEARQAPYAQAGQQLGGLLHGRAQLQQAAAAGRQADAQASEAQWQRSPEARRLAIMKLMVDSGQGGLPEMQDMLRTEMGLPASPLRRATQPAGPGQPPPAGAEALQQALAKDAQGRLVQPNADVALQGYLEAGGAGGLAPGTAGREAFEAEHPGILASRVAGRPTNLLERTLVGGPRGDVNVGDALLFSVPAIYRSLMGIPSDRRRAEQRARAATGQPGPAAAPIGPAPWHSWLTAPPAADVPWYKQWW